VQETNITITLQEWLWFYESRLLVSEPRVHLPGFIVIFNLMILKLKARAVNNHALLEPQLLSQETTSLDHINVTQEAADMSAELDALRGLRAPS